MSYQTDEGLYSDFFNGESEALNKFKKLNKDALPSMIKVVENPSLKKTLLSLAQTRATAKVGGMSEAFLDEQMRINMTPLNNTSGQAASRSSTSTKIKGIDQNMVQTLTADGASGSPYKYAVQKEDDTTDYEDLRVKHYDDKSIKNLIGYREGTWWDIIKDGKYKKMSPVPGYESRLIKGSTTSEDVNYNFKDFESFNPSSNGANTPSFQ